MEKTATKPVLSINDLNLVKQCENSYEFEYLDADGNETGFFISVIGMHSEKVKKALFKKIDRERMQKAMLEKRGKDVPVKQVEEDLADNIETTASCIVGWRGIAEDYSPELAIAVCQNNPLIVEQVKAAAENLANFTKSK